MRLTGRRKKARRPTHFFTQWATSCSATESGHQVEELHEEHIAELLLNGASRCAAGEGEQRVPPSPGFYAIFVDNACALPAPFAQILRNQQTELLYIGIATQSLAVRLVEQDLRHRKPSSFFRSLGAVLGFRPPIGSLWGKKNQCNYIFSPSDTDKIIEWINKHVSVQWICASPALAAVEAAAIQRRRPLLNITHNPTPTPEVEDLRELCRILARQAP
jgi:hypothetical protein